MFAKSLHNVTVKDADAGTFAAAFSVFDVIDSDGDVLRKGAFSSGAPVVVSAYGHGSWAGALPVGKGVIRETSSEAIVDGQFFLDTTHGRDAWATVKALAADGLQEWSYSLDDIQAERGEVDGKSVRIITKVRVKEVSPVLMGANPLTRTLAVKSGLKFSEHATSVLTDVDELITRAADIVMKRREQGKALGAESADMLARLDGQLQRLADLATDPEPPTNSSDEAMREYARFVATLQGETTS